MFTSVGQMTTSFNQAKRTTGVTLKPNSSPQVKFAMQQPAAKAQENTDTFTSSSAPSTFQWQVDQEKEKKEAKQKADQAYQAYKSLPLSEAAFNARAKMLIEKEEKKGTNLSDHQKSDIRDKLLKDIVNQWINVTELYFEAVALGHGESIVPQSPEFEAPVYLPGLSRELAREVRNDPAYRAKRALHQKSTNAE